MPEKDTLQQVFERVSRLSYSNTSTVELLSLALEASSTLPDKKNSYTKSQFTHILREQIWPILDDELIIEEKELLFGKAKENLVGLLQHYLVTV